MPIDIGPERVASCMHDLLTTSVGVELSRSLSISRL